MSDHGSNKSKEEAASDGRNAPERRESDLVRQHLSSPSPPQSCHDSCYNSDTENSPPASPGVVPQHSGGLGHEDVSRQVSDTLRAEHEDMPDCPSYQAKVEFAVKLGYTEKQLQDVLRLCGPDIEQNELLSKLIDLSTLEGNSEETVTEDLGGLVLSPPQKEFLTSSHQTRERTIDTQDESENLRPIVIDGSNVALSHGNKQVFSCRGIQIVVDWFRKRGHKQIFCIVPSWRKEASRPDAQITDQDILQKLELERVMVFTPARRVAGKRVVCYDDRYILKLAKDLGGIIVSNDNFRDLLSEFREVIEENLLMYSFVSDSFMPPDDPLGRKGPSLDNFLRKEPLIQENLPPVCPYAKKCTYGNKCKFYHPERGQQPMKMVTEKLAEKARQELQKVKEKQEISKPAVKATVSTPALSETKQPIRRTVSNAPQKALLSRKQSLAPTNSFGAGKKAPGQKVSPTKVKVTPAEDHISKSAGEQISFSGSNSRSALNPETKTSGKEGVGPNLYPYHWGSRPTLRPVNSEPIVQEKSSGENVISGHLAVAKKLSDEGRRSSSPKTQTGENERAYHRKVERTFSVKGTEDPRLQRMSKPGSAPAKPKFYFGDEGHRQTNRQHSSVQKSQTPIIMSRQPAHRQLSDVSAQHLKPGFDPHATIERMASAPSATSQEMQLLQTGFRTERQDSLSDPGLYIPDQATGGGHDETPVFIDPPRNKGFYNNAGGNNVRISVSQHNPGLKVMVNQPKQNSNPIMWSPYPIMQQQDMTMPHPCVSYSTSSGPPMVSSGWTGTQSSVGSGQFFTHPQLAAGQENQQGLPLYPGQSMHPSLPAQFIPAPGPLMMQNPNQHDPSMWRQIPMEAWHQNIQGNMAAFNASYHDQAPSARDAETEQKMFSDLSKIFPTDKVRRVMADHPEITDSSILCKYLV